LPLKSDRPRRIIADTLTPAQLHHATVSDGCGSSWEGGSYRRLEAQNRAAGKAAAIGAGGTFTKPEWTEVTSPDGVTAYVTRYRAAAATKIPAAAAADTKLDLGIPADLSIPSFLLRWREQS
jgi:hypothetical protein